MRELHRQIRERSVAIATAATMLGLGVTVWAAEHSPVSAARTEAAKLDNAPILFQSDGADILCLRQQVRGDDEVLKAGTEALRRKADKQLADGPYTVTAKKHPLPGVDVHEYVSLAPYHWPNPDTADHLPYLRHDGEHNPEVDDYDLQTLDAFGGHAYTLALAGYLTGEQKYLDRSALLIRTFLIDPQTAMLPTLEHAQLIRGENTGRHAGLLETRRLLQVIDAIGLLRAAHASSWTADDDAKINAWFTQYVDWMQNSKTGKGESAAPNNHGTWYDVQVVAFNLFVGNTDAARKVCEEAKIKRIAQAIEPDGSAPKELVRTKSLSYSCFNLLALATLANLGDRVSVDLWHYRTNDGRSIRAVIDNLLTYISGEKQWPGQQIVAFNPRETILPLRCAAKLFNEPRYQAVLDKIVQAKPELDDPLPGTQF